jgi:Zn-dependent protease with chaperone function
MAVWLERFGLVLLDASLAATVWVCLLALAMVATNQPSRRCALARVTMFGALLIWPLVAWWPGPRLDVAASLRLLAAPGARPPEALAAPAYVWPAAYLGGLALALGWLGLGWLASAALTRRTTAPEARLQGLYDNLDYPARHRRPRLAVSGKVRRPALAGSLRPTILLPRGLLEQAGTSEQVRLSLLHELAHASRRDPLHGLIAGLAQAVWFFLPPYWWVRRQMRLDQEFLADHLAASAFGGCATGYASSLVDLAGSGPVSRTRPELASPDHPDVPLRSRSPLLLRILMLVRCPFPVEADPPWWWRAALAPLAVAGILAVSSLSLHGTPVSTAQPAEGRHGRFTLPQLTLDPEPPQPGGAPRRGCTLPVPLPDSFDLALDILSDPASATALRLAGVEVVLPPAASWQRLQLQRRGETVRCQLDDRDHPCRSLPTPRPRLLHIALPDSQEGRFRNLTLRW